MTHIIIIFQLAPLTARVKGVFLAGSHQNDSVARKKAFYMACERKMTGTGIAQSVLVRIMAIKFIRTLF